MKITVRKDIQKERIEARRLLDAIYEARIATALGQKAALYAAKFNAAQSAPNPLVASEAEAARIIERHSAYLAAIAAVEDQRQAAQSRIDAACNAFELADILAAEQEAAA